MLVILSSKVEVVMFKYETQAVVINLSYPAEELKLIGRTDTVIPLHLHVARTIVIGFHAA